MGAPRAGSNHDQIVGCIHVGHELADRPSNPTLIALGICEIGWLPVAPRGLDQIQIPEITGQGGLGGSDTTLGEQNVQFLLAHHGLGAYQVENPLLTLNLGDTCNSHKYSKMRIFMRIDCESQEEKLQL